MNRTLWISAVWAALVLGCGLASPSLTRADDEADDQPAAAATEDSDDKGDEGGEAKEDKDDGDEKEGNEGKEDGEMAANEGEEMAEPEAAADPEMEALDKAEQEIDEAQIGLVEEFQGAEGKDAKDAVRAKLTELVVKHFELRQSRRELQIKRMEAELQKLREEIAKRNEAREKIVNKRLAQIIGDESELEF